MIDKRIQVLGRLALVLVGLLFVFLQIISNTVAHDRRLERLKQWSVGYILIAPSPASYEIGPLAQSLPDERQWLLADLRRAAITGSLVPKTREGLRAKAVDVASVKAVGRVPQTPIGVLYQSAVLSRRYACRRAVLSHIGEGEISLRLLCELIRLIQLPRTASMKVVDSGFGEFELMGALKGNQLIVDVVLARTSHGAKVRDRRKRSEVLSFWFTRRAPEKRQNGGFHWGDERAESLVVRIKNEGIRYGIATGPVSTIYDRVRARYEGRSPTRIPMVDIPATPSVAVALLAFLGCCSLVAFVAHLRGMQRSGEAITEPWMVLEGKTTALVGAAYYSFCALVPMLLCFGASAYFDMYTTVPHLVIVTLATIGGVAFLWGIGAIQRVIWLAKHRDYGPGRAIGGRLAGESLSGVIFVV